MPVKVLEVPVDDKEFKDFLSAFNKYQAELKTQPAAWSGVNQGISRSKSSTDEFAASMGILVEAVNKLTDAEAAREAKAERRREKEKRDREEKKRAEEEEAERQRGVVNRVREVGRGVGNVVKETGKWASGAMGGLTGGAAGLFGAAGHVLGSIPLIGGVLGGLATAGFEAMSTLNNTQRGAHSVGVNTETLQGWQTTLGLKLPQGAAENLLSTVSEAQATPGGGGLFGRFGIKNYDNKNVSDISAEMLTKAQAYVHANPGNKGLWGAKSLYGGALDTGTLRTLQQMSPKELQDSIKDMKKFADTHKNAEKTATDATNLLSAAEQKATSMLDNFAGGMDSALKQVTDALKSLYDTIQPFLNAKKNWQNFKPGDMFKLRTDKEGPIANDPHGEVFNFNKSIVSPVGKWLAGVFGADSGGLIGGSKADRNNNPGNIMGGGRYNKYSSASAGFSAMANQLQIDYNKHGSHSIAALINGSDHPWSSEHAPGNSHASTMNYIAYVAGRLGVGANQQINLNDKTTLAKVAAAMYEFESGHKVRGLPSGDTGHVAKAIEHAVKKGTVAAHKAIGHTVKIKTQSKPGSDVNVSARQLAGH